MPTSPRRARLVLPGLLATGCVPAPATHAVDRSVSAASSSSQRPNYLVGAWRLVETAVRAPGAGWDRRPAPQGGLFVFSQRHYSQRWEAEQDADTLRLVFRDPPFLPGQEWRLALVRVE